MKEINIKTKVSAWAVWHNKQEENKKVIPFCVMRTITETADIEFKSICDAYTLAEKLNAKSIFENKASEIEKLKIKLATVQELKEDARKQQDELTKTIQKLIFEESGICRQLARLGAYE